MRVTVGPDVLELATGDSPDATPWATLSIEGTEFMHAETTRDDKSVRVRLAYGAPFFGAAHEVDVTIRSGALVEGVVDGRALRPASRVDQSTLAFDDGSRLPEWNPDEKARTRVGALLAAARAEGAGCARAGAGIGLQASAGPADDSGTPSLPAIPNPFSCFAAAERCSFGFGLCLAQAFQLPFPQDLVAVFLCSIDFESCLGQIPILGGCCNPGQPTTSCCDGTYCAFGAPSSKFFTCGPSAGAFPGHCCELQHAACTSDSQCCNGLRCTSGNCCNSHGDACDPSISKTCCDGSICNAPNGGGGERCCWQGGGHACTGQSDCCVFYVCGSGSHVCESCHGVGAACGATSDCCGSMQCLNSGGGAPKCQLCDPSSNQTYGPCNTNIVLVQPNGTNCTSTFKLQQGTYECAANGLSYTCVARPGRDYCAQCGSTLQPSGAKCGDCSPPPPACMSDGDCPADEKCVNSGCGTPGSGCGSQGCNKDPLATCTCSDTCNDTGGTAVTCWNPQNDGVCCGPNGC